MCMFEKTRLETFNKQTNEKDKSNVLWQRVNEFCKVLLDEGLKKIVNKGTKRQFTKGIQKASESLRGGGGGGRVGCGVQPH